MTYSLENLLPPNILQPVVQILGPRRQILQLALVGTFNRARLADGHVQRQLDPAIRVVNRQPARPA